MGCQSFFAIRPGVRTENPIRLLDACTYWDQSLILLTDFVNPRFVILLPIYGCPSRKPHPVLNYLQLERSSAILLDRPAHPFFDGLLHIYGPRLRSLFAHPEPDRATNIARGGESRAAPATGRPQPENSPAPTASAGSILLGDSLAALQELAGGLDHCQTGDRHQMA